MWWIILVLVIPCGYIIYRMYKEYLWMKERYSKILSQKKSTEVRTGYLIEKVSPFLKQFPYEPQKTTYLGMPIDYICFDEDKITFIEIKSGNARLTKKQKEIKNLVTQKEVYWDEIRIS